ncbi:MAG: hypothetical protein M1537_08660 [Nitrospirae bacterium]|nr:hypothetical protein [Nitrospirota bacterium]MCL5285508.1 hypothetical protein [Nitrospirota bacterium]
MGKKVVIIVLGGALLISLVVTMVRISGPASGSLGQKGILKRESALREKAGSILKEANLRFPAEGGPVLGSFSLRFEGEVLRVGVGPGWDRLPRDRRAALLDFVWAGYVPFWQEEMKSRREPAIVFREGTRRVALHTSLDRWAR